MKRRGARYSVSEQLAYLQDRFVRALYTKTGERDMNKSIVNSLLALQRLKARRRK